MSAGQQTVIHVSPHPDDESIGAPCTLLTLQNAKWRVLNLACSLGRPSDHKRRQRELQAALRVAQFESRIPQVPVPLSGEDRAAPAIRRLEILLRSLIAETGARLIVGPHPREGHHGHVIVARAIRRVVRDADGGLVWWMWSIWSDLPRPTLVVDCDARRLDLSERMLSEYAGENGRNDYVAMHRAIRKVNAVRGVEKAFGFGSTPDAHALGVEHAELLTEVTVRSRSWFVGEPRLLDPAHPLDATWTKLDDLSILSSTRLRPFYRPSLMDVSHTYQRLSRQTISY